MEALPVIEHLDILSDAGPIRFSSTKPGPLIDLFRLAIDEGRVLQSSITGHPILANGEWQGL